MTLLNLSPPRNRAEIIAAFATAPPFPPTKDAPAPKAPAPETTDESDTDKAVAALKVALDEAKKAQAVDPDSADDDNDKAVLKLLGKIGPLVDELVAAQAKDSASDKPPATPPIKPPAKAAPSDAVPPAFAVSNTTPELTSTDEDGNVKPDLVCATDGCGHTAAAHSDLEMGANTGPCTTPGCLCEGFTFANAAQGNQTTEGGGTDNAGGSDQAPATTAAATGDVSRGGFAIGDSGAGVVPGDDLEPAGVIDEGPEDVAPGGLNLGPSFTSVAIFEGEPTGDGRALADNALSWTNGPWALMGLATSTHDPSGFDQNDPAVLCGRIESFERQTEGGRTFIVANGNFLTNDDGAYFAGLLEQMGRLPVSGDVIIAESAILEDETGAETETLLSGTIAALTILPHSAAFADCYIVLGANLGPTEIPQQTEEQLPIAASAQSVHWMRTANCVPCGQDDDVLVASGGPVRPPKAWFADPGFHPEDGRMMPFIGRGKHGSVSGFTVPPTVTEEGEVYGYIAPWDVCHVGQPGCVVAPHSASGYIHYTRGQHILTAEGDYVRVGTITANTGHADLRLGLDDARSHYDNTAFQAADVAVGEDEHGIWYHGALRPDATETQVRMLRASGISGDWRGAGRDLEMVAALAVNQPGFPAALVASSGLIRSLIGAGAFDIWSLTHSAKSDPLAGESVWARASRRLFRRDSLERIGQLTDQVVYEAREKIAALESVGS